MIAPILFLVVTTLVLLYYSVQKLFNGQKPERSPPNESLSKTKINLLPLPGMSIFQPAALMTLAKLNIIKWLLFVGQHGKIFELKLLWSRIVFINDYSLAKELFKNAVFCARPSNEYWTSVFQETGFTFISGKTWKEQRKFCHHYLKTLGFGTKNMEHLIHDEIQELLQNWKKKNGNAFSPNKEFNIPVFSSLYVLLAGERAKDAALIRHMLKLHAGFEKFSGYADMLLIATNISLKYFNLISKWFPHISGGNLFGESIAETRVFLGEIIKARTNLFELSQGQYQGQDPTNLIDYYLAAIHKSQDPLSSLFGDAGRTNLVAVLIEFITAGGDTISNNLAWAMLHLIRNPNIQDKIRCEIDTNVGPIRCPSLQDINNCPYTIAFIRELLRFSPGAALSVPHESTQDTNIGPHFISKGTWIFLNIYNIHHDSLVWGDPENFRPERFLSCDGQHVIGHEAFCAFSFGLRRCVGEKFALDNLFLFISAICQKFILMPDPVVKGLPPLKHTKSGAQAPYPFKIVAMHRSDEH